MKRAKEKFEQIRQEYDGVESADPLTTPFSDYLLKWIEGLRGHRSNTTVDEYERMARRYINPYFDGRGVTLADLTAGDLDDYYSELIKRGLSPSSVIKQHAIIRSTLQWARKHRWVRENVADLTDKPSKGKPQIEQPYAEAEVAELLKALAGDPLYVPVLLAAVFGLRRSEALGLRWSAIDFEARTFTIDTTVVRQHQDGKLVTTIREGTTKTESSARTLPLNDFAMKQLRHIKERQDHFRTICGDCYDTRYLDFVCVNKMGTLINPDYVSQTFAKQIGRAHV